MDTLSIEIPSHLQNEKDLGDWLYANPKIFDGALEIDTAQFDAQSIADVTLTHIQINRDSVAVHYECNYSISCGCSDREHSESEKGLVTVGKRHGNVIVFKRFKPTERRSTYDEL
jgi:hypothetical protein